MTADIERARRVADDIRAVWPEKAAEIDAAIARGAADRREGLAVKVNIAFKLEKFDGDKKPGQAPVEVIEGEFNL